MARANKSMQGHIQDAIQENPTATNQQVWDAVLKTVGRKHGFNRSSFDVACSIVRKKLGYSRRKPNKARVAKRGHSGRTTELTNLRYAHEFVIAVGDVQQAQQVLQELDGLQLS